MTAAELNAPNNGIPKSGKIELSVLCPKCQIEHLIGLDSSIITNSNRFPVKYAYIHGDPKFILTLFIDRNFQVRAMEVSEFLEMHREDLDKILDENKSNTLKDLSSNQIQALCFMKGGDIVRKFTNLKAGIAIDIRKFQKIWKLGRDISDEKMFDEYFLKFSEYWIAGVKFDDCELNLIVSSEVDLDRLSTQLVFLFEKIANTI